MTYSNPGIYVTEGPFSTNVASSVANAAAAFVGTAERGPTTPTLVQSWNSYKSQFGDLTANYEMGYALYHFFANGGRTAYVTRVVSGASTTAAAAANFTGNFSNSTSTIFKLKAASAGTWGNNLSVTISAGLDASTTPTFNLAIAYDGSTVENWTELSLDKDNARYLPAVVNTYSSYVVAYDVNPASAGASYTVAAVNGTALTAGNDGSALSDSDWTTALYKLDGVEGQLTINLVGQSGTSLINSAIAYVDYVDADSTPNARKNSFLVVDPDPTKTVASEIVTKVSAYTVSSYAAVYYGMLTMSNPAVRGAAALRATYPGGPILGLYQRVDAERGVGRAPAGYGYTLQNVYGVVTKFTEAQTGTLYNAHVNTLKAVPGAGIIVNGARTLKKTDITKYIPVRRTLNYVKAQTEELSKPALFAPINERLWRDLSGRISRMLADLWSAGALKGNNTSEAYYVLCNNTNNPQTAIDNGEVHIEIGVALQTPAEFIIINISQFTGGTTITEIL